VPKPRFQLLLISDGSGDAAQLERRLSQALSALPQGVAALQVREKALSTARLVSLCRRLLPFCRAHRIPVLVNERCDVALALGLDGVHLAQSSVSAADARALLGPGALIGVSCHDLVELELAAGHADYVVWGPVFAPTSKASHRAPLGLESLQVAARLGVPIYALGGIGPENAARTRAQGAHGVAVIGSGLGAEDPARAVAALWKAWTGAS
jgi:thiamine-phosphate pyrophosphorylase